MVVESLVRRRLTAWALVLTTQALVLMTGCGRSAPAAGQSGTAVVIFIAFSASVTGEDRASFRREIEAEILPSLSAGDRLLIAPIHDKTLTDFRPLVDTSLPARPHFNGFLDNVLKFNRSAKELDAHILLRSEEHTSELQSLAYLVCRLLLEKKKKKKKI